MAAEAELQFVARTRPAGITDVLLDHRDSIPLAAQRQPSTPVKDQG
jgi:hypothetical protein